VKNRIAFKAATAIKRGWADFHSGTSMKRTFASPVWMRVILALAVVLIAWSIALIASVKQQQSDLSLDIGLINRLNSVAQAIRDLEKNFTEATPNTETVWRSLYGTYRFRRATFDPGDPLTRDLQPNLIRIDSLLIRSDRLHADFLLAAADPALRKSLEADFRREISAATAEAQNAVQLIRARSERISATLAQKWNHLFLLLLATCFLALAVAQLVMLLQREMVALKHTDEALRQSEAQIRQTLERAPIAMAILTPEGKFFQVNQAFCDLLGYTEKELLNLTMANITHPDDVTAHREHMKSLMRREIPHFQLEKRYIDNKGQVVYALLHAGLLPPLREGAPLHYLEQVVDITERKKAELARRQNEGRFRELAESIPEIFWLTDPAKKEMLYVSPAYEKISGRSCRSLYESPQNWFTAIHPDDRDRVHKAALTKQVIGQYDETYRLQRPDGEMRWLRDRAFPIYDERGSVYRVAGIAQDLTAFKALEDALRDSAQRLSLALDGSGDGMWDWNAQTNRVFYSKSWKEMLGYQEHEVGDSLDEFYSRLHPEDMKSAIESLEKHLRGETPRYVSEHRVRCKGGNYKWILDRGKVMSRTATGAPARVVGTYMDMTEHKTAETALALQTRDLQKTEELAQRGEERAKQIRRLEQQQAESEKLAATGRIAARMALEINNPLAGIKNSFLLLKGDFPETHRYYEYVGRLESEIERIARIVRQMFDLYRPEHEAVHSFSADIAIRDVVALLKTNRPECDIAIDIDREAPALNVALPESSLRQALYNVIQNAIDASPAGGVIKIQAAKQENKLTISVIDRGQGIAEEIRDHIFEPFFTTKNGHARSGLGLGLAVSKGLIEAMGGALDFESSLGEGTTFRISLPLDSAPENSIPASPATEAAETPNTT
jgi:PAS domain S-box-containing protein